MSRPGPKLKVRDDELVEAVKETEGPFATAVEVSELVGLSPERVRERLKHLRDEQVLDSKRAGHVVTYWVA